MFVALTMLVAYHVLSPTYVGCLSCFKPYLRWSLIMFVTLPTLVAYHVCRPTYIGHLSCLLPYLRWLLIMFVALPTLVTYHVCRLTYVGRLSCMSPFWKLLCLSLYPATTQSTLPKWPSATHAIQYTVRHKTRHSTVRQRSYAVILVSLRVRREISFSQNFAKRSEILFRYFVKFYFAILRNFVAKFCYFAK